MTTPTPAGVAPITDREIALVRERSPVADVVAGQVQLVDAGKGNLTGLCPFHEEKSPSFNVTPTRGYWYCFGCGEALGYVQAGQGDPVLYRMLHDLKTILDKADH